MLFNNFSSDGIELCNVNQTFKFMLQESIDLFSLIKRYGEWIVCVYEITHNDIIMMYKKLKQQNEFFNVCKKWKMNKKIALEKKFMFITEEMLQVMKETKTAMTAKQLCK